MPVVIQVTQKVHEVRRQGAGNRPMTAHILDQPIRNALLTCHKNLSEGGPLALRYPPDISPFATAVDDSAEALAALARDLESTRRLRRSASWHTSLVIVVLVVRGGHDPPAFAL